ncbi:alpha/beta-hydrolase [Dichomitus squalens]|uniref:Alpha/beta-hydrolase n=1 Tax=Dichomitus squalens TaxID=114155 RepID=A0A4Q9Q8K2_9APHY|nr:alpha/beta-hydrolase [Dichomitus squalens]
MAATPPTPLVIVEGFLSCAGALVWGHFEQYANHACQSNGEDDRRTIFTSVGLVSSLHDRACELFYTLIGGTVDYGAKHARESGHSRFGRTHAQGLYPEWSSDRPLHFHGHSIGGPTLIKLQWLIATGFFGKQYHPDMILSISTVSAPFRGTQLVYTLGEDTRDAPNVRPLSAGNLLAKAIHVASYFAPFLPFLDLHAEARGLSFRDASFVSFLRQLWRSDWAESRDATPYDVTFAAADEREAAQEGKVNPNTYYRSYCATMSHTHTPSDAKSTPTLLQRMSGWPLYFASRAIMTFRFSDLRPVPTFLETVGPTMPEDQHDADADLEDGLVDIDQGGGNDVSAALRANDGVVPLFSQWHPYDCKLTRCMHYSHSESVLNGPPEKSRYHEPPVGGVWHVHHLENAHHFSIAPVWLATESQKAFWTDLGHWLRAVDHARRHASGFGSVLPSNV